MPQKFQIQLDLRGHQSHKTVLYLNGELTDSPDDEAEISDKFKIIKRRGTKTIFVVCSSLPHNLKIFGSVMNSDNLWRRMIAKYLSKKQLIYLIGALEFSTKGNSRT